MPRKKNKKDPNMEGDLDDDLETSSTVSGCSSESNTSFLGTDFLDENALNDLISKMENAIMELMNSRPDVRVSALRSLIKCLQNVYIDLDSESVLANSLSLGIESVLKRGTDVERILSCQLISVAAIQLGSIVDSWFKLFSATLESMMNDKTQKPQIRGVSALAISVLLWQSEENFQPARMKQILNNIFVIARSACLKGDGKSPVHDEATCSMQEEAIYAWIRVLLSVPTDLACELAEASIVHFVSIMQNVNVNLRIASAEVLAIIFEYLRDEKDDRFQGPYYRQILGQLDELISDSSKAVSKKDRKKQRTSLRPVLSSIRTQNHPEVTVKFGQEQVVLDTCALNFFYETLCDVLAHGLNKHLQTNEYLRDLFDLGPPIKRADGSSHDRKESKARRVYENQVVSKSRSQARNHNRNKKSDFQRHQMVQDE